MATAEIGRRIHHFAELPSTNDEAHRLAELGARHGEVVIAELQTQGRGRRGRSWLAPPGKSIALSVIVRPSISAARAPEITLAAAVAICEAARELGASTARIKWPNDVLLGGDKALANWMFGEDGDDYLGGGSAGSWSDPAPMNMMFGGEGSDTMQGGYAAFNYFYAAETGVSGMDHFDTISTGQGKYSWWTVEQQDANGFWLPDEVVHNITIDPPATPTGPWTV